MKLKSFEKVRTATCTEYVVFNGGTPVDYFTVDYLAKTADGAFDREKIDKAIIKRVMYENAGAKVRFVDTNSATGHLSVTIEI